MKNLFGKIILVPEMNSTSSVLLWMRYSRTGGSMFGVVMVDYFGIVNFQNYLRKKQKN
jgi:cytosine/uracil/thiamine/allantoin permease